MPSETVPAKNEAVARRVHALQDRLLRDTQRRNDSLAIHDSMVEELVERLRRVASTRAWNAEDIDVVATLGLVLLHDPSKASHATGAVIALLAVLNNEDASAQRVALATLLVLLRAVDSTRPSVINAGIFARLNDLVVNAVTSVSRLAMATIRTLARDPSAASLSDADREDVISSLTFFADGVGGPDGAYATAAVSSLRGDNVEEDEKELAELLHSEHVVQSGNRTDTLLRDVLTHHVVHQRANTRNDDIVRSLIHSISMDEAWNELFVLEDLRDLVVAQDPITSNAAVEAGVIPLCVRSLNSNRYATQTAAARVLRQLAIHGTALRDAVLAVISIESLVELLNRGIRPAVLLLCTLLGTDSDAQVAAIAAGVIPALLSTLRDGHFTDRHNAICTLCLLVETSQDAQIEALGGHALVTLLEFFPNAHDISRPEILQTIYFLLNESQLAIEKFLEAGGVTMLSDVLTATSPTEVDVAISIIVRLFENNSFAELKLTEAGVFDRLLLLLESEDEELVSSTSWALGSIAASHPITRRALVQGSVLTRLVRLLRVDSFGNDYNAVRALAIIAPHDIFAQDAIAAAGAI